MLKSLQEEHAAYKVEAISTRQRLEEKLKEQEKLAVNATSSVALLEKELTCVKAEKSSADLASTAYEAMCASLTALRTQLDITRSELSARFPDAPSLQMTAPQALPEKKTDEAEELTNLRLALSKATASGVQQAALVETQRTLIAELKSSKADIVKAKAEYEYECKKEKEHIILLSAYAWAVREKRSASTIRTYLKKLEEFELRPRRRSDSRKRSLSPEKVTLAQKPSSHDTHTNPGKRSKFSPAVSPPTSGN